MAVTLHEMASGELPSWGDDLADARFLDPDEEVQLAEDLFDPVARDGLVEFFKVALQRDAAKRFRTLHDMTRAWTDVFRDLETVPPLTTAVHQGDDEAEAEAADPVESARAKRAEAAAKATPATPLAAAGLSPYALSIAQQRLGIDTAGDLARVPARRITALRGIGSRAALRAGPALPRMAAAVQPHRGWPAPGGRPVDRERRSPRPFGKKKIFQPNGPGFLPRPSRLRRRRKT